MLLLPKTHLIQCPNKMKRYKEFKLPTQVMGKTKIINLLQSQHTVSTQRLMVNCKSFCKSNNNNHPKSIIEPHMTTQLCLNLFNKAQLVRSSVSVNHHEFPQVKALFKAHSSYYFHQLFKRKPTAKTAQKTLFSCVLKPSVKKIMTLTLKLLTKNRV